MGSAVEFFVLHAAVHLRIWAPGLLAFGAALATTPHEAEAAPPSGADEAALAAEAAVSPLAAGAEGDVGCPLTHPCRASAYAEA